MNLSTRIAFIGATIVIAVAAWITMARAATDKDFDLACAVVTAAEAGIEANSPADRNTAVTMNIYFLGRLSGRDSGTYWYGVVVGKVSELKERARSPEILGRCAKFFASQVG